jgi:hypothetical protein
MAAASKDRPSSDPDRLLLARISGVARRHARWGGLTDAEKAAGAAELREVAGGRAHLLAEEAGLALGSAAGQGAEYEARGRAVAELCRMAGAEENLIRPWIEEGRRRVEIRRRPPFSGGGGPRA